MDKETYEQFIFFTLFFQSLPYLATFFLCRRWLKQLKSRKNRLVFQSVAGSALVFGVIVRIGVAIYYFDNYSARSGVSVINTLTLFALVAGFYRATELFEKHCSARTKTLDSVDDAFTEAFRRIDESEKQYSLPPPAALSKARSAS